MRVKLGQKTRPGSTAAVNSRVRKN